MKDKIVALKNYLRQKTGASVTHEALSTMHRFWVDKSCLYIEQDVLESKSIEEILTFFETHNITKIFNAAYADTSYYLGEMGMRIVNVSSKKVPISHTHGKKEKDRLNRPPPPILIW